MWLDSASRRLKAVTHLSVIFIVGVLLSGCLRPMYGGPSGEALRGELAAISVEPIPNLMGHYLAQELRFALNGSGSQVPPKYKLMITLSKRLQTPLIDTVSGRATSGTLIVDANYRILPLGDKEPVLQGVAFTTVSYDRSSQRFANLRASRDAEIRAAKVLAAQIHVRIASTMAR